MEYNYMSFLMDFCFMSLLLVIAQFLRAKIKFFQMFYIPAIFVSRHYGAFIRSSVCKYHSLERPDWLVCVHAGLCVFLAVCFWEKRRRSRPRKFSIKWAIPSVSIWALSSSALVSHCWSVARLLWSSTPRCSPKLQFLCLPDTAEVTDMLPRSAQR